ncbi:hypothetical protein [Streptomyces luteireticuli]|uniref:hypothetical protein n=1 Tax=Streptomyces luteireticuli TaxID=173858 RepID=UPI003556176F
MSTRRGKKRQFNFAAVEHVGNDADEGGFLGNEEAEQERQSVMPVDEPHVPSPATEPAPRSSADPAATATPAPAPEEQRTSAAEAPPVVPSPVAEQTVPQPEVTPVVSAVPAVSAEIPEAAPAQVAPAEPTSAKSAPAEVASADVAPAEPVPVSPAEPTPLILEDVPVAQAAPTPRRPDPAQRTVRTSVRVNEGPTFSAVSAEPPVLRAAKPKRSSRKEKPAQAAVLASFAAQRTGRNWGMWSGRLVPETVTRLKDRAEADAASSGRGRLSAGHYLDAALRSLPKSAEEQVALANEWLIERWDGEHPAGRSAQFSVSPVSAELLNGLRQSLRGYRHGIVIDVVCAAVDAFLDVLEAEGPIEG